MERLTKYLGTMFGTAMFLEEYHSYDSLPMYLTDQYQLLRLQCKFRPLSHTCTDF